MNIKLVKDCQKFDLELIVLNSLKKVNKKDKNLLKLSGFTAQENKSSFLSCNKKYYVGASSLKGEDLKIAFSNAIKSLKQFNATIIKISLNIDNKEYKLEELVEGLLLGSYEFNKYKSKKKEKKLDILIDIKNSSKTLQELEKSLRQAVSICSSVNLARDIVNTTPEDYYPKIMANDARKISKNNSLECKVFGEDYLLKNGMNAMLSVGRASRHESQLIHIIYKPKKDTKRKIVIVGKGLTYDSGGLSLKSSEGMLSMKCDKSGGSTVLGVMNTLKDLNCPYEVHGIVGAVENMIGGDAYKPDDVLKAKNGTTIEVRNTDAEGRLVLADCLCYAQDEIKNIDYIFDIATLTGACLIALGEYTTGVMGHSEKLKTKIAKAGEKSGELVAFLPYNRYLFDLIRSQVADISNTSSSRAGGTITASMFLDKFIKKENKKKWLHFDIAGPAYKEKSWGYNPYGASGAGVRLILSFIENLK